MRGERICRFYLKKGVFVCLLTALLLSVIPVGRVRVYAGEWDNAYNYYQKHGNEVVFRPTSQTDGNIYFGTKAARASTNIRYRTIGWKVKILSQSGETIQTLYFKLGGSYLYKVNTTTKSGAEYNLYVLSLSNLKRRLNRAALAEMTKCNTKILLDACMIVVNNGRALGTMNDSGPVSGNVYTTNSGIAGAAGWGNSALQSFHNYFDKSVKGLFFKVNASGRTGIASVSGGGEYCYGTCVTLKAAVKTGYVFQQWTGPSRSAYPQVNICVSKNQTWVAEAKAKELTIVFHRSRSASDTATVSQKVVYGKRGQKFKNTGWNTGKDQVGWTLSSGTAKKDYSVNAAITDNWINKHSPKVDLYAVWKKTSVGNNKPQEPEPAPGEPAPQEPTPQVPEPLPPTSPGPPTATPVVPDPADDPDDTEEQEKTEIHCRFISRKYFEDENGVLVPSARGGLSENSRWATDQSLRALLRSALFG